MNKIHIAVLLLFVTVTARLSAGRNVVLWISVDGLRSDYIERAETPTFDKMMRQGAYSMQLVPVFPTATFVNHVSQATGVRPGLHGIVNNSFFDRKTGFLHRYPGNSELLDAEPIWLTAARQGVRSASLDWPLSHNQKGDTTAAYFENRYNSSNSDNDRMSRLLQIWRDDNAQPPLQLLMGYILAPDKTGHQYGPDAKEIEQTMQKVDTLLKKTIDKAIELFDRNYQPDDILIVMVTTDHGMADVHTLVHPGRLAGLEDREDMRIVTSANVAHIYRDWNDVDELMEDFTTVKKRLQVYPFAHAYLRENLPEHWDYNHPHRTGDIVIVMDKGYTFSSRPDSVIGCVKELGGPLGMHGYDPDTTPEMIGPAFFWRYPDPLGGIDLGTIHCLQLHPTVAALLNIIPASDAVYAPLKFDTAQHHSQTGP